jgi:hypothetical protein
VYERPKQDFDGALRFIEANRIDNEPVLTAGLARYPYRQFYGRHWTEVQTRADLSRIGSPRRAWLVYSFPEYMDRGLVETIRRDCRPLHVFPGTLGGGEVIVCTLEPRSESSGQLFGATGVVSGAE